MIGSVLVDVITGICNFSRLLANCRIQMNATKNEHAFLHNLHAAVENRVF
jgi:hypothetical protein